MTLLPDHWRTFVDSMRGGAIRDLGCRGIDFSALDDDALMVAVGFRGLRSLLVYRSIFSSRFVTDDLIRASVANSLSSLTFSDNTGVDSPLRFSQDAVLDFFFRAYTPFESRSYYLSLDGSGVTDTFLVRLFDVGSFLLLYMSTIRAFSVTVLCNSEVLNYSCQLSASPIGYYHSCWKPAVIRRSEARRLVGLRSVPGPGRDAWGGCYL